MAFMFTVDCMEAAWYTSKGYFQIRVRIGIKVCCIQGIGDSNAASGYKFLHCAYNEL